MKLIDLQEEKIKDAQRDSPSLGQKRKNLIGSIVGLHGDARRIAGVEITNKTKDEIWVGDFYCNYENLISLEGAPKEIKNGSFKCYYSSLESIKGAPEIIDGIFDCSHNHIDSLKGAPRSVTKFFDCSYNLLENLKGAEQAEIKQSFNCSHNELVTLEGAPQKIGGSFICSHNKLESLKDVHKFIKEMDGDFIAQLNSIKSHILGVLYIKGCTAISLNATEMRIQNILNSHLPNLKGHRGVFECQCELQDANLDEYAQL